MGSGGANNSAAPPPPAPKILLAKPGLVTAGPTVGKFGRDDDTASHRSRAPAIGSLNLLSESWDLHIDRFLPFLTENTDFTVVGVIGPPGAGKSTIMNELYGFDGSSPGMLPPFNAQSEENRAMAKHCTSGIEPRVTAERFILLDTQPVFSASGLAETMRPDGSSTVSVLSGENLSAELAQEIMAIQLGVLLASICHVVLVVSDGVRDDNMWRLLLTVDLLKHGIPDPSSLPSLQLQGPSSASEKENIDKVSEGQEYMATPVFVHTKMQHRDCAPYCLEKLERALVLYFGTSSFMNGKPRSGINEDEPYLVAASSQSNGIDSSVKNPFVIPLKSKDDFPRDQHGSYECALWKLRDQILSMKCPTFAKAISEREWLKSSAKIWEFVKSSAIISEYSKALQNSGMFRR